MLTIRVNGREKKFNVGCRTFVSLDELLKMLEVKELEVTHNGGTVSCQNYAGTTVKGGDTVGVTFLNSKLQGAAA